MLKNACYVEGMFWVQYELSFINSICNELLQKIIQIESQIQQQKKKNNI